MRFGHREELLVASTTLIAALGEVAIAAGIELIVGNFDFNDAPSVSAHWVRGRGARLHATVWPDSISWNVPDLPDVVRK